MKRIPGVVIAVVLLMQASQASAAGDVSMYIGTGLFNRPSYNHAAPPLVIGGVLHSDYIGRTPLHGEFVASYWRTWASNEFSVDVDLPHRSEWHGYTVGIQMIYDLAPFDRVKTTPIWPSVGAGMHHNGSEIINSNRWDGVFRYSLLGRLNFRLPAKKQVYIEGEIQQSMVSNDDYRALDYLLKFGYRIIAL